MGNYRSRPSNSCSDELLRRMKLHYSNLEKRIKSDIVLCIESKFSEIDKNMSLASLVNNESLCERFDNGLTLLHICCWNLPCDNEMVQMENQKDRQEVSETFVLRIPAKHFEEATKDIIPERSPSRQKSPLVQNKSSTDRITFIKSLLKLGADSSILSKNGFSPLHMAAYKGDADLVEALTDDCSYIDHTGAGSLTCMHIACLFGQYEVAMVLAEKGANLEARDSAYYSPLHLAALYGYVEIVELLVIRGVDINIMGSVADSPLHLACSSGHTKVVRKLLKKGAKVKLYDEEGNTELHFAAKKGSSDTLNLLLQPQFRNDVNIVNIYHDTPLHLACYEGNYNCARMLLTYGGSGLLLKENIWAETPLHAVCTGGKSVDLLNYLLGLEVAFVDHQGFDGHTPLHSACYHGHIRFVQCLLSHGVDINITTKDYEEQTPLCWAYERGFDKIVNLLKHFRRPGTHDEYSRGEFLGGLDNTFFPIPSPKGKLRIVIKEKLDVLYLRSILPEHFHLNLGDIEYIESIGSGSFGKVFKGKYKSTTVAVKRYRANVNYGKSDAEMFCREVSILGSLNSSYIVKFVGACLQDPSQFAIVTEYMSGGSLFFIIHEQKQPLEFNIKLSIAMDVARGMWYLHTLPQPIIHRDLNSHNILIDDRKRARVADFGESRFLRNISEENMTVQPGNLRWMAPEVFIQCPKYSIKADVFSFGLCLWEMITCELPFAHLKPAAAAADMAYKNSRPPLDMTFSIDFSNLLESAWHKIPEERPNFSQIIKQLESLIETQSEFSYASNNIGYSRRQYCSNCVEDDESRDSVSPMDPPTNSELSGHLSALRNKWQQVASKGQSAFKNSHLTLEDLRRSVNPDGYVEGNTYQFSINPDNDD